MKKRNKVKKVKKSFIPEEEVKLETLSEGLSEDLSEGLSEEKIETTNKDEVNRLVKEGYIVVEKRSPFGDRVEPLYVLKKEE